MLFVFIPMSLKSQVIVAGRMTNFTSREVFEFLNGARSLKTKSEQQFSKLEFIFKTGVKMDRVSVESCNEPFQDGADIYSNYSDEFKFIEGGTKILKFDLPRANVEAVTINFRRNVTFCLKKIVIESEGHEIKITAPQIFSAKFTAAPKNALNLFDSKLNTYMMATNPKHPLELELKLNEPLTFDQIMLWPGNYTNDIFFKNFGRPKDFSVLCDQHEQESFELNDVINVQRVRLKNLKTCKAVKLKFGSGYEGIEVKGPAISELRFMNQDQILLPDLSELETENRKSLAKEFEKAGLEKILERQLLSVENSIPSMVRLHADGSFFIHGFDELAKEHESFYILGEMTSKTAQKNRIELRLRGIKKSNRLEMDSLSCGRKCLSGSDFATPDDFFDEDVLIRKGKDGFYRIDTLSTKKIKRIDFTSVRFLLDHTL